MVMYSVCMYKILITHTGYDYTHCLINLTEFVLISQGFIQWGGGGGQGEASPPKHVTLIIKLSSM